MQRYTIISNMSFQEAAHKIPRREPCLPHHSSPWPPYTSTILSTSFCFLLLCLVNLFLPDWLFYFSLHVLQATTFSASEMWLRYLLFHQTLLSCIPPPYSLSRFLHFITIGHACAWAHMSILLLPLWGSFARFHY